MRKALVLMNNVPAGVLTEIAENHYQFSYQSDYQGAPISLTMPIKQVTFEFKKFPPFFEGLLPEGILLEALLRKYKLDKEDYFGQLLKVGNDVIGAVTVEEMS
jgi:serine/threonine-protein kinase HipA